jgi:hypothetical protein
MRASILVAVLGVATSAWAVPVCERAVALRVNQSGLDFVVQQVKPLVPTAIEVPAIDQVVVDWPLTSSDARVQIPALTTKLALKELMVFMDGGALHVRGVANVSTSSPVKVLNPYAGLGSADCQADVDVVDLELQVGVLLESDGGRTRVELSEAKIKLDNDKSVIALKGCTLGNILTPVIGFVRKHFMGAIQSRVEKIAKEKVPPLLEAKLNDTIAYSGEAKGFGYSVALAGLSTDESGVGALLSGGIGWKDQAVPACLKDASPAALAPASCVAKTPLLQTASDAMFGAGVSEALLQQALHSVWRSGLMCVDSRALASPLVGQTLSKLAASLGQPPGTALSFQLRLGAAPSIRFTRAAGVTLDLEGIFLDLALEPPLGESGRVALTADLAVSAAPWVDPATNSLALDLRALEVGGVRILGAKGQELGLDPARLQRFVAQVALPVLQQRLQGLQLSPAVLSVLNLVYLELRQLTVGDGWLAAYLNAHSVAAAAADKTPPVTTLQKPPPALVGPQVLAILVGGSDDRTPAGLLRYKARVDGGAWSEPSFSRRVDVVAHGGTHSVEIAAIDLAGNVDPKPLALRIRVDDRPPALEITARPPSLLVGEREVEIAFAGADDQTAPGRIAYQGELYRVPDAGGAPELVQTRLFAAGIDSVRFDRLDEGVYKARVIARDEAGNVTSQDVGFTVHLDAGCALGHAPAPCGLPLALLPALALCAIMRRCRRRRTS